MNLSVLNRWRQLALVLCVAWLSGCATQLAPAYDKAVVDGLNAANTDTMTLFASASGGTQAATFNAREAHYNGTIGKLDALAVQAASRPVPKNKVTDAVNQLLDKRKISTVSDDDATPPSVAAIQKVSATLGKMRDTDHQQGLTALEVQGFKNIAVISFDQAITYENFLNR
jgi:hypothetical protein